MLSLSLATLRGSLPRLFVARSRHHALHRVSVGIFILLRLRRYPVGFDGVQPARNLNHGTSAEVSGEEFQVDRGGHDDEAELGTSRDDAVKQTQEQVRVEVPLVRLVYDEDVELV